MLKLDKKTSFLILLVILFIAGFLRLYALDSIPPGLYPDEAMNANDAFTSPGKVFYPENGGREGLYINLVTISFKTFGPSPFSLRLVSAIIGILSVLGLYLLTNELFQNSKFKSNPTGSPSLRSVRQNSRKLALLASFLLAISFWHINFSRIGFRGILLPFILVFCFYFLFQGLRKKNVFGLIISGLFFGLGFYTYSSFRLAFLILPFAVIPYYLLYRKEKLQKKLFFYAFCFMAATFIIVLPLGFYFLSNPADFFGRLGAVSIFSQNNPIKTFFISLGKHLAMFNVSGDFNWRHNLSGSPQLLWPVGILFLLGFLISIKKLFLSFRTKNYKLLTINCFLLSWFFVMLLPGALTYEGLPHSLRTIGVIPVVYIFAALGGFWLFEKMKNRKWLSLEPKNKFLKSFLYFVFIFLTFTLFTAQFQKYFDAWANNPNTVGAFTQRFVDIGNVLNSLPQETQKYVIVNEPGMPVPYPDGVPTSAQTIMFLERMRYQELRTTYLKPEQINQIKKTGAEIAIIPMRSDNEILKQIRELFPNGYIQKINNVEVYEIN